MQALEEEVAVPEIWNNPDNARAKTTQLANLHDELDPWQLLKTQIKDISELMELGDDSLADEFSDQLDAMENNLAQLRQALRFTGKYDHNDAILRITAGTGGTEAMDWSSMLERMYLRWAERNKVKVQILDRVVGEEAGIKTCVMEMSGPNMYGKLKSEHGAHRLVRLSPFNADHLRQTSFALVEVLPVIRDDSEVQIDPKDLRIDVYHSGGHGGQSVNTTNSAVRITHIPTNTVVTCQDERSQLKNKDKAMKLLKIKMYNEMQEAKMLAEGNERKTKIGTGDRSEKIRTYNYPQNRVTDHRIGFSTMTLDRVMQGALDPIIEALITEDLKRKLAGE